MFEIAKTATGYASTPTTLVSFNHANGAAPVGGLIADADGDLFGTTELGGAGGASNEGTVFEIARTASGYASTPTTLVSFNGTNGALPVSSLIADADGDLFGTTGSGGASAFGTVFEISGSGFVPPVINNPPTLVQPVLAYTLGEGHTLQGLYDKLLANARDVDAGDQAQLTISSIGESDTMGFLYFDPAHQRLTYTADGHNAKQPTDSFTYTISDPSGATVTGTVDVTVTGASRHTHVGTPGADRLAANAPPAADRGRRQRQAHRPWHG